MYEQYYGLVEKPFNLTPDTEFYYQSLTHQEALNVLLVAIKSGDGFIKLTGEVGTGKTLLCRKLLDLLDDHFQTIYIPNPYMSCDALLRAVVEEMGLLDLVLDNNYLSCINKKLIENAQQNIKTIILLDEATSSLDAETENKIQDAINFLTKDRTTIVIAHRLSTILNSDKIYVVDAGKVVDEGTHDQLLANSKVYKNFYEKQIKKV